MQRLNILLVEDDPDMRALYGYMLASAGHHVKAARNGMEALMEIQANRPDIVLTDVAMPILSGIGLIKAVKGSSELADLPIVAMTSHGAGFRELALAAGATDSIDKPTDEMALRAVLDNILAQQKD